MSIREYLLNGPLGFGAAPLGNMFRNIPDEEAEATVDAAWHEGTRYYDTAPFYGAGLSEIRLGNALKKYGREEFRLSTKVGRIILDEVDDQPRSFGEKGDLFKFGRSNKIVYDYTEAGTLKSIEDSLKRLQVDYLDFVWVHDIARDFHGDEWIAEFEVARKGAFRERRDVLPVEQTLAVAKCDVQQRHGAVTDGTHHRAALVRFLNDSFQ